MTDQIGLCACGEGPLTQAHLRVCRLRREEKSELEMAVEAFDALWDSRAIPSVAWDIFRIVLNALRNAQLDLDVITRHRDHEQIMRRESQAQNERIMAWAMGRCECCGHEVVETECCHTVRYCGLSQEERNEHLGCNWTPPKEWEVKG